MGLDFLTLFVCKWVVKEDNSGSKGVDYVVSGEISVAARCRDPGRFF